MKNTGCTRRRSGAQCTGRVYKKVSCVDATSEMCKFISYKCSKHLHLLLANVTSSQHCQVLRKMQFSNFI